LMAPGHPFMSLRCLIRYSAGIPLIGCITTQD
jgi:hypothetical protein